MDVAFTSWMEQREYGQTVLVACYVSFWTHYTLLLMKKMSPLLHFLKLSLNSIKNSVDVNVSREFFVSQEREHLTGQHEVSNKFLHMGSLRKL